MKSAPLPDNEAERLAALNEYELLDTPADAALDAITRLAAQVCEAPIALISLVDRDRQWVKSAYGLNALCETPRDVAFCAHTILGAQLMEVPDAAVDGRFQTNPLVKDPPNVRFYAGKSLITPEGYAIGTLCVVDLVPRSLLAQQRSALEHLAQVAMALLVTRKVQSQATRLGAVLEHSPSEIYVFDAGTLKFVHVNAAARNNLGYSTLEIAGLTPHDLRANWAPGELDGLLEPLRSGQKNQWIYEARLVRKDRSTYPVEVRLQLWRGSGRPVFIAIANEIGARRAQAKALRDSEARFRAIVSHTPGMVFQFASSANGVARFSYVSDGCIRVLGVLADSLLADPSLLLQLVLPEDRDGYTRSMAMSEANLSPWNWEGRLWIEAYRDVKWVNLRASPHRTDEGSVLWSGIMTNITQSKRAEAEIKASREHLRALSAHAIAVREQERTRIAREIHDDLGGNLTAIKIDLNWLAKRLDANRPELLDKIRSASSVVDRTMETAQQIARDLRPGVLDCGIVAAVKWQAEEFRKRLGIGCEVNCREEDIALEPETAIAIFRIFQEALTNISKHAHASHVVVRLQMQHDSLELEVADNGRGINEDAMAKQKSFGIRGMMERSSLLSGEFSVSRPPEGGTVVRLSVPLLSETQREEVARSG